MDVVDVADVAGVAGVAGVRYSLLKNSRPSAFSATIGPGKGPQKFRCDLGPYLAVFGIIVLKFLTPGTDPTASAMNRLAGKRDKRSKGVVPLRRGVLVR